MAFSSNMFGGNTSVSANGRFEPELQPQQNFFTINPQFQAQQPMQLGGYSMPQIQMPQPGPGFDLDLGGLLQSLTNFMPPASPTGMPMAEENPELYKSTASTYQRPEPSARSVDYQPMTRTRSGGNPYSTISNAGFGDSLDPFRDERGKIVFPDIATANRVGRPQGRPYSIGGGQQMSNGLVSWLRSLFGG